jgi:hypothetical protein
MRFSIVTICHLSLAWIGMFFKWAMAPVIDFA